LMYKFAMVSITHGFSFNLKLLWVHTVKKYAYTRTCIAFKI
jgi:hypothetical protein